MYAAPDGGDREVYVFLRSCSDARSPLIPKAKPDGERLGIYYEVRRARVDPLPLPDLPADEQRALAEVIKDLRSLCRPRDFDRLGRWVDARLSPETGGASLAIVVAEPHLDTKTSTAYAESFGFVREKEQWSRLPMTRGSDVLEAMTERLGACP